MIYFTNPCEAFLLLRKLSGMPYLRQPDLDLEPLETNTQRLEADGRKSMKIAVWFGMLFALQLAAILWQLATR